MPRKKKNYSVINRLFSTKVGVCNISMILDVRHSKGCENSPLCLCFSINRKRVYHSLGERYSCEDLTRITNATGQGERKGLCETNFERKLRLSNTFSNYVSLVEELNESGVLSLDRIKTMLTGRAKSSSFVEEWENVIEDLLRKGKAGTADNYRSAMRCFNTLSGFTRFEGFAITKEVIERWIDAMKENHLAEATQGIYLRSCRAIVNHCIDAGYMMQRNYMFGRGKSRISIPNGNSRRDKYLDVDQMTQLFYHWKNHDLNLPLYHEGAPDNPPFAVKTEDARGLVYLSLGMFLMQYLSNGCNLVDLALLRYNQHYYDSNARILQFIRHKTHKEANDGSGKEVVVPIIEPLKEILLAYAAMPAPNALVFPFLLGDTLKKDQMSQRNKVKQEGKNIADRMKKVAQSLNWTQSPTGTWCRHSFATNLNTAEVPMSYISEAMGHSVGNSGMITKRYMAFPIEQCFKYNRLLIKYESKETLASSKKDELLKKLERFSEADLKEALIELSKKELENLTSSL